VPGAAVGNSLSPNQPGASWPAPSGYYYKPKPSKPTQIEVKEAAKEVASIVSHETYFVSPEQIARMASAIVRKEAAPDIADLTIQIEELKSSIKASAAQKAIDRRKVIERQAAYLAALMAFMLDLQAANDDDLLLLAAA
jgi:hypothetical protein